MPEEVQSKLGMVGSNHNQALTTGPQVSMPPVPEPSTPQDDGVEPSSGGGPQGADASTPQDDGVEPSSGGVPQDADASTPQDDGVEPSSEEASFSTALAE